MPQDDFADHLKSLWMQGSQEVTLAFLRRALTHDSTLAEVLCALQFEGVKAYLDGLRLSDVVGPIASAAPMSVTAIKPVAKVAKGRRRRRSLDEMNQMRTTLLQFLGDEGQNCTTSAIVAHLAETGYEIDSARVSLLLKQMVVDNLVVDLGGKPKSWRAASTAPQRAAEPMYIKKKQSS